MEHTLVAVARCSGLVCVDSGNYQDLVLYLKEAQNARVTTESRTLSSVTLNVTDGLDNYMFDHALTIKVDIDDSWDNITVTQNGVEIPLVDIATYRASKNMSTVSCAVENGYLYIDVIPDGGKIIISSTEVSVEENGNGSGSVSTDFGDIMGWN